MNRGTQDIALIRRPRMGVASGETNRLRKIRIDIFEKESAAMEAKKKLPLKTRFGFIPTDPYGRAMLNDFIPKMQPVVDALHELTPSEAQ